ncbi:MAG: hypothetical protein GYA51_19085 [Candidatus Methanofastidiosa archaeon]|jgi:hypothetical protein|nr:hypothetical protein [Candidatus Methanofastidiosa archaeon]
MPGDVPNELNLAIEPPTEKEKNVCGPYDKVTPVTHPNIGGYFEPWMDMWINFWDLTKDRVNWVSLDELTADSDWTLPDWQIPINKNAPYTPEKVRPLTSYDNTEKVQNPCKMKNIGDTTIQEDSQADAQNKIVLFHKMDRVPCVWIS